MWSPDHDQRSTDVGDYAPVLGHELVHVIQFLIMGRDSIPVQGWFSEGLPEAMVGGTAGGAIRGLDRLDDLTAEHGALSPISFTNDSQITSPEMESEFAYPMSQLAVEYLFDTDGLGKSPADARNLMIDVAGGTPFESALEKHMGISLASYQAQFFDLMDLYLPQSRDPWVVRILAQAGRETGRHVAVFSLAVGSLVAFVLIWGQHR